ncbi:MAG TPA: NAD(P)H-binding protein [Micromonosporaceae bacterium]|nr:NAD(P)H-binding protein [Micromonosporaceae bacterium]
MRYVIVGCGAIGLELAKQWSRAGHHVVGTTSSPARLPQVAGACAEALVVPTDDASALRAAVAAADAVVLAARPRLRFASSRRDRAAEFRRKLLLVTRSVALAQPRLLLLSSFVVYGDGRSGERRPGDGGQGDGPIDERVPASIALEPAAQSFSAAERTVLESGRGGVLRLPEVTGHPDDLDDAALIRFTHRHLDGKVPFAADALYYRIDYRDAAAAAAFAVERDLVGVYNAVPDAVVPPTVEVVFGKLVAELGLPPVTFTGEVRTTTRPVSSAKLRAAGFTFRYA